MARALAQGIGCGLLALVVTGEILEWQLAVMGMLVRRGDSTPTFWALTAVEVCVLLAGVAMYAVGALKTHRMHQWGVWGEPELEQSKPSAACAQVHSSTVWLPSAARLTDACVPAVRKQLRPSGIITVLIVLMWLVRVFAWVPVVCDLERQLAFIRCRDMVYPEDGEGWEDRLRGREGCALVEPPWCAVPRATRVGVTHGAKRLQLTRIARAQVASWGIAGPRYVSLATERRSEHQRHVRARFKCG